MLASISDLTYAMCVNFYTDYIDSEPSDFEHLLQISRLHYSGYKPFVLVIFSTIEHITTSKST